MGRPGRRPDPRAPRRPRARRGRSRRPPSQDHRQPGTPCDAPARPARLAPTSPRPESGNPRRCGAPTTRPSRASLPCPTPGSVRLNYAVSENSHQCGGQPVPITTTRLPGSSTTPRKAPLPSATSRSPLPDQPARIAPPRTARIARSPGGLLRAQVDSFEAAVILPPKIRNLADFQEAEIRPRSPQGPTRPERCTISWMSPECGRPPRCRSTRSRSTSGAAVLRAVTSHICLPGFRTVLGSS